MNEFERRKCLEIMNTLLGKDICRPFREKVDPIRDNAPNYFEIITKPMDLSTIKKKLVNNEYKNTKAWYDDVCLVWSNAMTYNPPATFIHSIASDMNRYFKSKYAKMPRNRDEEWIMNLQKVSGKLIRLSAKPPVLLIPQSKPLSS